jgi:hypothetical protein
METEIKRALNDGDKAAQALVDHMKIMGASSGHLEVPDEDGVWVVEVRFEEKS